jgi:hypothetical protein
VVNVVPPALSQRSRAALLATLLLLPVTAIGELVAGEVQRRRVPSDDDWRAAAAAALAEKKPGDVIVVAPRWAEGLGRMALSRGQVPRVDPQRAAAPGATLLGLDGAFDARIAGRSDLDTAVRVIELSAHRADDPATKDFSLEREQRFGALSLRVLRNPHPEVLVRDLTEEIDEKASVRKVPIAGGAGESCRWETTGYQHFPAIFGGPVPPAARFSCPPNDPAWSFVGATIISDLSFTPRRCIAMHPLDGARLTVQLPKGRIGKKLVAYMGLHAYAERDLRGPPVHARISVGDRVVAERTHEDGEGWVRFEGATAELAGQEQTITLETWTDRPAGQRFTCIAAQVRE